MDTDEHGSAEDLTQRRGDAEGEGEGRYFPGDAPELRERLDGYLAGLGERLGKADFAGEVAFLLLAGGYGRGEGGIFEEGGRRSLYNDLEFYLVLKSGGVWEAARRWCGEDSHEGEHETGIEVEFKILGLGALRSAEPSMFYYDLLAAHRLVFGDAALVAGLPDRLRDGAKIPAHEAARLLFNRGSGLFYSRYLMEEEGGKGDLTFVERNHAKARLAFADAVLAMNGRYVWSCRTRHERLREGLARRPGNFEQLAAWHETAVEFKFHPRHEGVGMDVLLERQRALEAAWSELFLWVESIRLEREFRSAEDYAFYKGRLFPEFPMGRNLALHARDRLRRGKGPGGWMDYPRAPLQRALALLIGGEWAGGRGVLGLPPGASRKEIYGVYRKWWGYYN
jgi:hypothetical protein